MLFRFFLFFPGAAGNKILRPAFIFLLRGKRKKEMKGILFFCQIPNKPGLFIQKYPEAREESVFLTAG